MENRVTQITASSGRIEYINAAEGIGIILVLFGHLFRYGGYPSIVIFSFRVMYNHLRTLTAV